MAKKRFKADDYDNSLSNGGPESDSFYDDLVGLGEESFNDNNSLQGFKSIDKDLESFTDILGENIDPFADDLEKRRAQGQSNWSQLGNGVLRLANVVPGVVGGLASAFDIPSYFNTSDTSNWLTDYTNEVQEELREATPIYKENPDQAFDMADPAWWIEGGSDTIKSAAEFIVEGIVLGGVGKAVGSGLKAIRNLNKSKLFSTAAAGLKKGDSFKKIQDFAGASANAYVLNHIETLMETNDVYNQTLTYNMDSGTSFAESKELASKAAAMTAQINKLNFLLNITSAGKLLKSNPLTRNILKPKTLLGGVKEIAFESGQESIEELVNHIGAESGKAIGRGKESIGATDVIEYLSQDQAWGAAFWGAMGGTFQTGGTKLKDQVQKVDTEKGRVSVSQSEQDNYETQQGLLSEYDKAAKDSNSKSATDIFNDLGDQIVLNNQILDAQEAKDYQKVEELEKVSLISQANAAFKSGTTEKLIELYKGFENGPQQADMPNDYKEKAQKAVETIERLENVYNRSQDFVNQKEVFLNRAFREEMILQYDRISDDITSQKLGLGEQVARIAKKYGIPELSEVAGEERLSYDLNTLDLNPGKTTEQTSKYNDFLVDVKKLDEHAEIESMEANLKNTNESLSELDNVFNEIITPEYQASKEAQNRARQAESDKFIEELKKEEVVKETKAQSVEKKTKKKESVKKAKEAIKSVEPAASTGKETVLQKLERQLQEKAERELAAEGDGPTVSDVIENAATDRELDKILKQLDELGETTPALLDEIIVKRQKLHNLKNKKELVKQNDKEVESSLTDVMTPTKVAEAGEIVNKVVDSTKKENSEAVMDSEGQFDYHRTPSAYNKLAFLSRAFVQAINTDGTVTREDVNNELLNTPSKAVLDPKKLLPGSSITFEVDDNIDTEVYNPLSTDKEKTTWGVLKATLTPTQLNEHIPIVIKDENGKNIAFLHSIDWIKSENVKGDLEHNRKHLRDIRNFIVSKGKVNTTITNKTAGELIVNKDGAIPLSEAMPDAKLPIATMSQNKLEGISEKIAKKVINDIDTLKPGLTYTLLKTSNGDYIAAPVSNRVMNADMVSSVSSAIEAFISGSHNEMSEYLRDHSNMDVTDIKDLKKYVNQFAYLFNPAKGIDSLEEYLDLEDVDSDYRFLTITGNSIDFGSGGGLKTLSLSQNTPENKRKGILKQLNEHLSETYFNTNTVALNGKNPIIGITDTGVGVLANTYNDLVKENTGTNLLSFNIGTEQDPNYIYTIQPRVEFDTSFVSEEVTEVKSEEAPVSNEVDEINKRRESELKKEFGTNVKLIESGNVFVIERQPFSNFNKAKAKELVKLSKEINAKYDAEITALSTKTKPSTQSETIEKKATTESSSLISERDSLLDTLKSLKKANMISTAKVQSTLKEFFKVTKQGVTDEYLYNQAVKEIDAKYDADLASLETTPAIKKPSVLKGITIRRVEDVDDEYDEYALPFSEKNKSGLRKSVEHLFIDEKVPFALQHSTVKAISTSLFVRMIDKGRLSGKEADSFFAEWKEALKYLQQEAPENKKALYNPFIDNYSKVRNLVVERIRKYAGVKVTDSFNIDELDFGTDTSVTEKKSFEDGSTTFLLDTKDTMSSRLKLFMAGISADIKPNRLGLEQFMEFDDVSNELMSILVGKKPDYNSYIEILSDSELQASKPWIKNFVDKIQAASGQVQTEFTVAMTKHHVKMNMVLWKVDNGEYTLSPSDSNSGAVKDLIISDWKNNLYEKDLVTTDSDGNHVIDKDKISILSASIESFKKETPGEIEVIATLESLGLDIDSQLVSNIISGNYYNAAGDRLTLRQFMTADKTAPVPMMVEALRVLALTKAPLDSLSLPYTETEITHLAKANSKFVSNKFSASHKAGDKTIWSYSNNKYANNRHRDLKALNASTLDGEEVFTNTKLTQLSQLSFNGTHNDLMRMAKKNESGDLMYADNGEIIIDTNSSLYSNYEMSYLSLETLKKIMSEVGGAGKLTKNAPLEHEVVKLALLGNRGSVDKYGRRRIKMFYPTMSDKSTMLMLETIAQNIQLNPDGSVSDGTIRMVYEQMVLPELNRISAFNKMVEEGRTPDVKGYNRGANKFLLIPELNMMPEIIIDGKLQIDAGKPEAIIGYLKKFLDDVVSNQVEDWKKLGVVNDKGNLEFVDSGYLRNHTRNTVNSVAADYAINYMLHNASIYKNYVGDPAIYYKSKSNDAVQQSKDTFINMGKRLAGDLAPGYETVLKGTYSVAFVSDPNSVSKNIKYYTKVLDGKAITDADIEAFKNGDKSVLAKFPNAKPYFTIEGADAQEFTAWKEHLKTLEGTGKISEEQHKEATRLLTNGEELKGKLLNLVLQPLKPVHVDNKFEKHNDLDRRMYIKTSSFPLIPQMTSGLELDKLRIAMEGPNGVDKIVFYTAAKVGAPASEVEVYNADGTISDNIDFHNKMDLSYEGWRIQQDVPYKELKDKVNVGTQERKLLFSNIKNIGGFKLKGKEYSGGQLEQIFNSHYQEMYEGSYNELVADLEWDGKNLNREKLGKMLLQEAKERDYPLNDQLALEIENNDFKVPLWALSSTEKIESMLGSLVNNNVVKQKHHGKSYVLGTEEGFSEIKSFEDASEDLKKFKNKIVWTSSWKGELLPHEFTSSTFRPSQILVPTIIQDSKGKLINVKDYAVEVDGKLMLDEAKIPKNLLELFGFRIPTQGHNSMMMMEIVGFLPQEMGDLLIASKDLTIQMGSDFDVDKLYTYQYNVYQKEDGSFVDVREVSEEDLVKEFEGRMSSGEAAVSRMIDAIFGEEGIPENLRKAKQQLRQKKSQNEILDIHNSVMSNPNNEVQRLMAKPLDFGDLDGSEGLANVISTQRANRLGANDLFNPSGATYQRQKYINASAGKDGVGALSLDSVFHAVAQGKGLRFLGTDDKPFSIKFGSLISTGAISNAKTLNNDKYVSDVIAAYQSAAVDNEKEQILDKLNINGNTFNVIKSMALLGFDESAISAIISQDIIFEFVDRLIVANSTLTAGRKTKNDLYLEMEEEFSTKLIPSLADKSIKDLLEYVEKGDAMPDYEFVQQSILAKFMELDRLGQEIADIQLAVNTDSGGISKSIYSGVEKMEKVNNLHTHASIMNADNLIGEYKLKVSMTPAEAKENGYLDSGQYYVKPTTINGYATMYGAALSNNMFATLFPYGSKMVVSSVENLSEISGKSFTEKDFKKIFNGLKSFLYTDNFENTFDANIDSLRNSLMFDEKVKGVHTRKSLASTIRELKVGPMKNHPFIGRLQTNINFNGNYSVVTFDAAKGENFDEEAIYMSVIDLITRDSKLPNGMSSTVLMEQLIQYAMINGGIQQAREFVKYIPVEYFNQIGFTESLRDIDFDDSGDSENFTNQYVQNNPFLVPETQMKDVRLDTKAISTASSLILLGVKEDEVIPPFVRLASETGPLLFKFDGNSHSKVSVLSNEYDISSISLNSAIESRNKNVRLETIKVPSPKTESQVVDNTDKLEAISDNAVTGKQKIISLLEQVDVNEKYKGLVEVVKKALPDSIKFSIDNNLKHNGLTKRNTRTGNIEIVMNGNSNVFNKALLHESIHAVTIAIIKEGKGSAYSSLKSMHSLFKKRLEQDYTTAELDNLLGTDTWQRASKSLEEFVAISMTDDKFQSFMKTEVWKGDKTFFDKLIDVFKIVLNSLGADLNPTILKEVMNLINDNTELVSSQKEQIATESDPFIGTVIGFDDFIGNLPKTNCN